MSCHNLSQALAILTSSDTESFYSRVKLHAIGWVKHKCIPGAKWPEIQAEMRIWKKRREGERKETGKYTSVVDLARARANQQYTENSTGKISPVIAAIHREYKQTWKTLDDELAYALWPGDVDAGNIDGSIHRWAKKEVIDNDREDWKRISASMRKEIKKSMSEVIMIVSPGKWVSEEQLIALKGIKKGTLKKAREKSFMEGREYKHVAHDGMPWDNSPCFYNLEEIDRWIERQASARPRRHLT
ncbi:excisionase family protein [Escherichia coli]|nr:excisionase family protein [Escherichia coli]EIY5320419.1 excisionase family protein [Escherichia coli]